jgi:hypothetical protein
VEWVEYDYRQTNFRGICASRAKYAKTTRMLTRLTDEKAMKMNDY